jgi:hypothetical protein
MKCWIVKLMEVCPLLICGVCRQLNNAYKELVWWKKKILFNNFCFISQNLINLSKIKKIIKWGICIRLIRKKLKIKFKKIIFLNRIFN